MIYHNQLINTSFTLFMLIDLFVSDYSVTFLYFLDGNRLRKYIEKKNQDTFGGLYSKMNLD